MLTRRLCIVKRVSQREPDYHFCQIDVLQKQLIKITNLTVTHFTEKLFSLDDCAERGQRQSRKLVRSARENQAIG